MSRRKPRGWRVASVAALLGLIGSGIAALTLADGRAGSTRTVGPSAADLAPPSAGAPPATVASTGLRLLQQAAAACQDTSYRGVQVVLWWGQGPTTVSVVDVWHEPGQATVVQAAATSSDGTPVGPSAAAGYQDPDGILGVSPQLLDLLQSNYQVVYTGRGTVAGRGTLVVEVRHPDGALAARFWLDAVTKLPLRREMFAGGERMISEDAFTDLQLGNRLLGAAPALAAAPWTTQLDAAGLASLRSRGWPLPGRLPANLLLFDATQTSTRYGQFVGLSYSDGLAVVSLFVQRGEMAGPMPGWRQVSLDGRTVYAADQGDRSLAWSSGGFVYTLIADASAATVGQVVAALPGSTAPGFWQRIGHGLHRLASWANPLRS